MPGQKAYTIYDNRDNYEFIFARDKQEARKIAERLFGVGEEDITCERHKSFDVYAPGPIPKRILIDHGREFSCGGCGQWIDDQQDDFLPTDHREIVEDGDKIFCSPSCQLLHRGSEVAARALEKRMVQEAVRHVAEHYPDARISKKNATSTRNGLVPQEIETVVEFYFPGGKHVALLKVNQQSNFRPRVFVMIDDLKAWSAYLDSSDD